MAKKKRVQFGPMLFETAREATAYIRSLLHSVEIGHRIVNDEHVQVLKYVFLEHPNSEEKLAGHSIEGFKVDYRDGGTRCFYVIRDDGIAVHFSYKKCLGNQYRHGPMSSPDQYRLNP